MCRNIKTLRNPTHPATAEDCNLAALQYVRKVTGYRAPSRANQEVFDKAVQAVAETTRRLLDGLVVRTPPGESSI